MSMLTRAVEAFQEGYSEALLAGVDRPLHQAMAVLLEHIGAELVVLDADHPNIKAHEAAHFLVDAARQEVQP